jgi:hypothetical protein
MAVFAADPDDVVTGVLVSGRAVRHCVLCASRVFATRYRFGV